MGKQVDQIIQQHPALLYRLNGIIELLSPKAISSLQWQSAHDQFASFMKEQREHEHRENEIIKQGFNDDFSSFLD